MKKIITHLKENWIRHGFETLVVTVGILGAFTLNSWNEERKREIQDIEFLNNLKIELSLDMLALAKKRSVYKGINDTIVMTIQLFDTGSQPISSTDYQVISTTLNSFQVLTPVYKNIGRNDIIIAQGRLGKIDKDLNRRYLTYLEETESQNAIVTKLGETLQLLETNYVNPKVDYKIFDNENNRIYFDFKEIKDDRGINNAIKRSFRYREFYLGSLDMRIKEAENLIQIIDDYLNNSEITTNKG